MNKINLLLIGLLFFSINFNAQLDIVYPGSTVSLSGTTQVHTFPSSTAGANPEFDYTIHFDVINNSDEDLSVACRRIETDVMAGIKSTTCWLFCPFAFDSGLVPDWIVSANNDTMIVSLTAGATNDSFVFHYSPLGVQGTSTYNIRFVNANDTDETYAEIDFELNHLTNSISELDGDITIQVSPIPANDFINISTDVKTDNLYVTVYNLKGESVMSKNYSNFSTLDNLILDTSQLPNGMYLLSVGEAGVISKTTKLVVQH